MRLFKPGDVSKAICECCAKLVSTTFEYRDVPFDDGNGRARDVLVAVCEHCETVVSVPPQSTPAIQSAREVAAISVEVVMPASLIEMIDAAIYRIQSNASTRLRKPLLAYYIKRLATDTAGREELIALSKEAARDMSGPSTPVKRLSMKVSPSLHQSLESLTQRSGLRKSEVLRAVAIKIRDEVVLPDDPLELITLAAIAEIMSS